MPGPTSVGIFRIRCRCEQGGRVYASHLSALVSRNPKPGAKPWRITFFNERKEPKVHFNFDDADGWKREGPVWLLEKLQDYVDRYIETVEEVTFEPYTGLTKASSEH